MCFKDLFNDTESILLVIIIIILLCCVCND